MQRKLCAGLAASAGCLIALNLFLSARARKRATGEQFIFVDGVKLHYTDTGEGPVLVALHGSGSLLQDFQVSGFVAQASNQWRVIAFDRPGYGLSTRPRGRIWTAKAQAALIASALQELGVSEATVMGHSWGTLVGLELALAQPRLVSHLVLLSGYYFPTPRPDVVALAAPALPALGTLFRYTVEPLIARLFWPLIIRRLFAPAPVTPGFAHFPKALALTPAHLRTAAAEAFLLNEGAFRLKSRYRDVATAVTVVAGADDKIVSCTHSERVAKEIPGSRLVLLDGVGHMAHHSATSEVLALCQAAAAIPASGAL